MITTRTVGNEWKLKNKKYALRSSLESEWEKATLNVPTGIWLSRGKIQNEPQQGQATLHPAAKSSNF